MEYSQCDGMRMGIKRRVTVQPRLIVLGKAKCSIVVREGQCEIVGNGCGMKNLLAQRNAEARYT